MNVTRWSPEEKAALVRMAAQGRTAKETGFALGFTRNAVLGMARRMGVAFQMTNEKQARAIERRMMSLRRTGKRGRGRRFTDRQIAYALAAKLAGLKAYQAAELIGASQQAVYHWLKIPELKHQGHMLFIRARTDAARRTVTS